MYIAERDEHVSRHLCYESQSNLESFRNTIWLSFVTFLTIGYGDWYPLTTPGRFVIILVACAGLFYSATIIGLINEGLDLTSDEEGLYTLIKVHR